MTFWRQRESEALTRDDAALVRGEGCFTDDIRMNNEACACVLRSPHAHALIQSIDTRKAKAASGVLLILTAADIASWVEPLPCMIPLISDDGTPRAEADRVVLAGERVRHVGDPVAFVVAETVLQALNASELIEIEYEILPACVDPRDGARTEPFWPGVPKNLCFDWRFGDGAACRKLFEEAHHVTCLSLRSPRVAPAALEPRVAIGLFDPDRDAYTLVTNSQGVHFVRRVLAKSFNLDPEKLRVVTPNVGGGFGSKIFAYPEQALVLIAACVLHRPVRWTSSRTEAFMSDIHARDRYADAALAMAADGTFLALRVTTTVNLGAYLSQYAPLTATGVGAPVQAGAYRFRAIEIAVRGVLTNTVPVDAYRGAGRPEANYVLERLIDSAARELCVDPAELRARNLPDTQDESLVAVTGLVIDGGRFLDNQRRCLEAADYSGFAERRALALRRGLLRGFGFANYLESNGGLAVAKMIEPDRLPIEAARLVFGGNGTLTITLGTQSTGQDHALPMTLHAAESLGLLPADISVRQGDTAVLGRGGGTGGSKSLLTSSVALEQAIADVTFRGRSRLAREWNAQESDISFEGGVFSLSATNRSMSVAEVAAIFPGALDGESHGTLKHGSCANGCHACELEIEPTTGETRVINYTAVDDFGEVVSKAAVLGQVQGGVAQGIGQALMESVVYDGQKGQMLSNSFLNYVMPRAEDVPSIAWIDNGLASRTNVFGAKACGEAGASAAPPAVMNALMDALAAYPGARTLQMPARAIDVWRVIHAGS